MAASEQAWVLACLRHLDCDPHGVKEPASSGTRQAHAAAHQAQELGPLPHGLVLDRVVPSARQQASEKPPEGGLKVAGVK